MKQQDLSWRAEDGLMISGRFWAPVEQTRGLVALVHGHGEHSGRYGHVAQFFADRGFAVAAMDQRGHGRSEGKRGHSPSYEHLMNDIARLIEEGRRQVPEGPLILYGHSMGGAEVLNFVLRRKPAIAGTIVTGPLLRVAFEPPPWKIALGRGMQHIWPSLTQPTGLKPTDISRDAETVRLYAEDPLVHDKMSAKLFVDLMAAGEYALERAHEFPAPLFLVHGAADCLTAAGATREFGEKMGTGCTLKLYEDWFHEVHNEPQREQYFDDVRAWLSSALNL
jgi:acylglycerol lipase